MAISVPNLVVTGSPGWTTKIEGGRESQTGQGRREGGAWGGYPEGGLEHALAGAHHSVIESLTLPDRAKAAQPDLLPREKEFAAQCALRLREHGGGHPRRGVGWVSQLGVRDSGHSFRRPSRDTCFQPAGVLGRLGRCAIAATIGQNGSMGVSSWG